MKPKHYGLLVRVFAAACTGTARLSGEIGVPLVLIDTAVDPEAAIAQLNRRRHGCAVRWPASFQPLYIEEGWSDWAAFRLENDAEPLAAALLGVQLVEGCLQVHLPVGGTLGEFRAQLAGALRHMRLQEVTIQPAFLEARCDAMAELVVHPRYTPARAAEFDHRDARIAEDIYAIDPAEDAGRLFWLVVAARAAAMEGRSPWR